MINFAYHVPYTKMIIFMTSATKFGEILILYNSLQVFGKFLTVYFLLGKMLCLLLQTCYIFGIIFIVANGQISKNNLTIWSHRQ